MQSIKPKRFETSRKALVGMEACRSKVHAHFPVVQSKGVTSNGAGGARPSTTGAFHLQVKVLLSATFT